MRLSRALLVVLWMAACGDNKPPVPFGFTKHVLDTSFRAEGVTVFDVDRDGNRDIVTRELWWSGPDFTKSHELRTPMAFDVMTQYATSFHATHLDVDGDGNDDLVSWGFPGQESEWCRNPAGADEHWQCTQIAPINQGETPGRFRLFDGEPEVVVSGVGAGPERRLAIFTPDGDPVEWSFTTLSPMDFEPAQHHGLGAVDINGDRRPDIVTGAGWLQQPSDRQGEWLWHPTEISMNNITHISGHDFNADGRMDLIGTSPHNRGVWWLEQGGPSNEPTFTKHVIDESISQTHASVLFDMNGDGFPDLVTGKRRYAHFAGDPGIDEPIVLVVYRSTVARDGSVSWDRMLIDEDSGVGNEFDVADMNVDGKADIVIASRNGVFWFEQN